MSINGKSIHPDAFLRLAAEARSQIQEIAVIQLAALPPEERPLLVDVREESEWAAGHVEGSLHLSRGIVERRIGQYVVDAGQPIVCYCQGGNRGALVAESLQKLGYTNVTSLAGGLNAWLAAGLPTTLPNTATPEVINDFHHS